MEPECLSGSRQVSHQPPARKVTTCFEPNLKIVSDSLTNNQETAISPGARSASRQGPAPSARVAAADPGAILDTSTPKLAHQDSTAPRRRRFAFGRSSRRMYSRVMMGLSLPGRYYFITLTTTPTSPSLVKSWDATRKYLHRQRPGACWCYCFTDEGKGQGVIHMVIRLGPGEKRFDARTIRAWWEGLTGARQVKLKHVSAEHVADLASYLANQKRKKGLGREFAYQSAITRWRWSRGWLPKGFTQASGRVWARFFKEFPKHPQKAVELVYGWLQRCHQDQGNVARPPSPGDFEL